MRYSRSVDHHLGRSHERRKLSSWSSFACAAFTLLALPAIAHDDDSDGNGRARSVHESKVLVSNGGMSANFTDENLINGRGVAFNPTGFVWVNVEGTGKSVLFDGNGPMAMDSHNRWWSLCRGQVGPRAVRPVSSSREVRTSSSPTARRRARLDSSSPPGKERSRAGRPM